VSGRPGARFGPDALRSATLGVEDYSPYLDRDISEIKLFDSGDLEIPFGDTDKALGCIRTHSLKLLPYHGRLISLGGEHLVSWPVIEALYQQYGDKLFVIQFDAHADMRTEYLGVTLSHATIMNLITGLIGINNTAVIGIRSGTKEEWKFLRSHPHYFYGLSSRVLNSFAEFARAELSAKYVYITLDLDVFDPSIFPGTGTPEPGGISFRDFIDIITILDGFDIVGADIVELAPDYDHSGISSALAATVLRELLLIIGKKQ
jgi:agmatinase